MQNSKSLGVLFFIQVFNSFIKASSETKESKYNEENIINITFIRSSNLSNSSRDKNNFNVDRLPSEHGSYNINSPIFQQSEYIKRL